MKRRTSVEAKDVKIRKIFLFLGKCMRKENCAINSPCREGKLGRKIDTKYKTREESNGTKKEKIFTFLFSIAEFFIHFLMPLGMYSVTCCRTLTRNKLEELLRRNLLKYATIFRYYGN